jgi:hypothetical protein
VVKEQSNRQQLVALNFRVPLDLRRRLKIIAASRSISSWASGVVGGSRPRAVHRSRVANYREAIGS